MGAPTEGRREPARTEAPTAAAERGRQGVTARAVAIAVVLMPLNAYWVTQMELVRYEGHPTTVSLFFNTIFILTVLLCLDWLLGKLRPRWRLHRHELLVIYFMLCLASALAGHDMIQVAAPAIPHAAWMATPENKWQDLFFRYLPWQVTLMDKNIIAGAFEGGSTVYTWPRLRAWSVPVLNWTMFLMALLVALMGINSLFRKRWTEREKLTYPIIHLPIEMTAPRTRLFRSKLMWAGFAAAALIDITNGLHELWPAVPLIKVRVVHFDQYMSDTFANAGHPWNVLAGTRISFYPFAIGLGLLLPEDLLFSCWFFYLFWRLQFLLAAAGGWMRIPGFPFVNEQSSGAYLGLCLFALWTARGHLGAAARRALGRQSWLSDEGEPLSYRGAFTWIMLGSLGALLFSVWLGMGAWVALLFFALYYMLSIAVTRIRAELGPPAHDLHYGGPDQMLVNAFGTRLHPLGPKNLTVFSMYWWFNRAYRSHPSPHQLEAFKAAEITGLSYNRMLWALMLAGLVGALSAFWANVACYYKYGMEAKVSFAAISAFGREPYVHLQSWLQDPVGTDWPAMIAYAVGIGFTLLLMALRVRFVWWPFHPVGYAISSSWSMNCLWVPLLIAWLGKVVLTRYGGYKVFRGAIPFALGLILGEFLVGSIWTLIGLALQIHTYAFWV